MRKSLLLLLLVSSGSLLLEAGPCSTGTLATYDAHGFSCEIDGLTFSDFTYSTSQNGGAFAPDASGVTVIPQAAGFQFQAFWAAGPEQTEDCGWRGPL